MSHAASTLILNSFHPGVNDLRTAPALSLHQSNTLSNALLDDACSYTYSGIVTLAESVLGADQGMYSWSAVKAYYATFYFLRALLAVNGIAVFHHGNHYWLLVASAGQIPQRSTNRNTHKLVIKEFDARFNSHPLVTQPINAQPALEWLTLRREEANYKIAKFIEPSIPKHFAKIADLGVRQAVCAYVQPNNLALAFDEDHAILAYPITALRLTISRIGAYRTPIFQPADLNFLKRLCRDRSGLITDFNRLFQ